MDTLHSGDLAYWVDDDRRPVNIRVVLITAYRVYVECTGDRDGPHGKRVWFETLPSARRRIAPRKGAYLRGRQIWHDPDRTRFAIDERGLHP